jgi:uncharacterized protein (UPF0264 family)
MKLLVSVADASEAAAAMAGGADIIDAKNPRHGALGAVSLAALGRIAARVDGVRPLSAALGDATDEVAIERQARAFAAAGARFVKVGFAGAAGFDRVAALTAHAVRGAAAAGGSGVVAVAYADADRASRIGRDTVLDAAVAAGAVGVLLDTADKAGRGLRALVTPAALSAWVARAHAANLFAALAGKLTADDLRFARDAGADIAGVRGAACEAGRTSRVSTDKVRELMACLERSVTFAVPSATRRSRPRRRSTA